MAFIARADTPHRNRGRGEMSQRLVSNDELVQMDALIHRHGIVEAGRRGVDQIPEPARVARRISHGSSAGCEKQSYRGSTDFCDEDSLQIALAGLVDSNIRF